MPAMDINGIDVAEIDWVSSLEFLRQAAFGDRQILVSFLNANNANLAAVNTRYRQALRDTTVFADGIGVDLAARLLHGKPFPANLNGTDLIPAFLASVDRPLRVALLGGRPEVLKKAGQTFKALAPAHDFIAVSDGFFGPEGTDAVLRRLTETRADIVLVALGSPYQELWVHDFIRPEHGKLVIGVGALFDFVSGDVPRAPGWVRSLRCEWIFRLSREPRRLWRRYVIGNPRFLYNTLRYKWAMRRGVPGTVTDDSTGQTGCRAGR